MSSILEVHDLHVAYFSRDAAPQNALSGVSFSVTPGEILGVLGESGSGKSTLAAALLRLLPANANISRGAILLHGTDILRASDRELQKLRGQRISLIFQEPSVALHPTIRVGDQVLQVLAAHQPSRNSILREKARQVLALAFPEDTHRIYNSYPHQLSGGQRQRVLIAQAIACRPSFVIADEPTASLDPATQMEIVALFRRLRDRLGLAMIIITHNPALLAGLADRVLVLYAGRIAELGSSKAVLAAPRHPYARALFRSIPALHNPAANPDLRGGKLPVIPGDSLPSSLPLHGCVFEPRCAERMELCTKLEPEPVLTRDGGTVSCFKYRS